MRKRVVQQGIVHEIVVEKSRFIAYVKPLQNDTEFNEFKMFVKKDASGARHYPYAYVIDQSARSSDDGEPSGTAGRPLMELINNLNLTNVAVIVVRYFGGIKLGAGRLLRTYVEAANQALSRLPKYLQIDSYVYQLDVKTGSLNHFEKICAVHHIEILERVFNGETVKLKINAPSEIDILHTFNIDAMKLESSKIYQKEE